MIRKDSIDDSFKIIFVIFYKSITRLPYVCIYEQLLYNLLDKNWNL